MVYEAPTPRAFDDFLSEAAGAEQPGGGGRFGKIVAVDFTADW